MKFVFPSAVTMGKITRKKCQNYFRVTTITTNDMHMVKCCRNKNFEELDTERSTGKNNGF